LVKSDGFEIQKRALPAPARAGWPPDSRSDIEDIGRTIETIEDRFPKRGEVVEADEGGALCPETQKA
jgi:hypothetical protein